MIGFQFGDFDWSSLYVTATIGFAIVGIAFVFLMLWLDRRLKLSSRIYFFNKYGRILLFAVLGVFALLVVVLTPEQDMAVRSFVIWKTYLFWSISGVALGWFVRDSIEILWALGVFILFILLSAAMPTLGADTLISYMLSALGFSLVGIFSGLAVSSVRQKKR